MIAIRVEEIILKIRNIMRANLAQINCNIPREQKSSLFEAAFWGE